MKAPMTPRLNSAIGGDVVLLAAISVPTTIFPIEKAHKLIIATPTVVGQTVEWLHKHPNSRLCIGDALIDHYRQWVWRVSNYVRYLLRFSYLLQECPKTYSYRSRLRDPKNPAEKMKCNYCTKCE